MYSIRFNGRAFNALANFGDMLDAWMTLREGSSVGDLMDIILEQTGYREYIDDGTEEGRRPLGQRHGTAQRRRRCQRRYDPQRIPGTSRAGLRSRQSG